MHLHYSGWEITLTWLEIQILKSFIKEVMKTKTIHLSTGVVCSDLLTFLILRVSEPLVFIFFPSFMQRMFFLLAEGSNYLYSEFYWGHWLPPESSRNLCCVLSAPHAFSYSDTCCFFPHPSYFPIPRHAQQNSTMCIVAVVQSPTFIQLSVTLWAVACQAPLSMGFCRPEYCSGLTVPSPGDLPNPGIKPVVPALAGKFFTTESPGYSTIILYRNIKVTL